MATNIDDAFEDFASRLTTSNSETAAQAAHRIALEQCLTSSLQMTAFFMSGSFGRATNIRNYSDVDRFAVLPPQHLATPSRATLVSVNAVLRRRFVSTHMLVDPPGIRIDFADGEERNEIIPVFEIERRRDFRIFLMSNRGQDWIKTTPEAYANFVDTVDQAHGNRVKPLIRFVKAWKYFNDFRFISSFYLEVFTTTYAENLPPPAVHRINYPVDLQKIFELLAAHKFSPLPDRFGVGEPLRACVTPFQEAFATNYANGVASSARQANRYVPTAGIHGIWQTRAAFAVWYRLYRGHFPAYR